MKSHSSLADKIASVPPRHDNDNPLWQGPCGEGPLGGVTQSMIVRFLSCRERFRLKYILGLEPHDKWNKNIGYGNMWHACEEGFARDGAWQVPLIAHFQSQLTLYPLQREEITKWFNVCCVQFPEYVKYWSEHPDVLNRTPLMQEQVFDVPYQLPSGRVVRLRGKFDSVDLIDGGIWLQENKTKGSVDKQHIERQLSFDLQTMMYLIALERVREVADSQADGWAWTNTVRGVRYNVVKRDCPIKQHEGRMLKAGWKEGESVEHWMERLRTEYYGAEPDKYFFRTQAEIGQREIKVFRETCLDPLLENLCRWYDEIIGKVWKGMKHLDYIPSNYRTPFGVYSALEEDGATEYDAYLETNSEAGLRRVETLFKELQ